MRIVSEGEGESPPVVSAVWSPGGVADHAGRVERLAEQLARFASDLFAGEARFLGLIGEFDQLGGWADGTTRSMAHWLVRVPGAGVTAG